jgi:TldD protein
MHELAARALDLARARGARYADVRIQHNRQQSLSVRSGQVEAAGETEDAGLGVRVLLPAGNGGAAWGFAATARLEPGEVDRATALAIEIARASALVSPEAVELGPPVTPQGRYATPVKIDPFTVGLDDKLAVLLAADEAARRVPGLRMARANLVCLRTDKQFANSDGADVEQELVEVGGGLIAVAVEGDEIQQRSYPSSIGRQQCTGGWELVLDWDLPGNAERIAGEAVQLLRADPCPSGVTTIVLSGDQVALQVHESCGHPIELDRVFGSEAAYAGTSFLTTDKLGHFHYGSEHVNLTADAVRPLGLGTFGWDDEGVPASSTPIVRAGLFVGYLMSRESASRLGLASNGCMRASNWNRVPLIRMTNVSLEPGHETFDDLIGGTDEGIYMQTNRSWSIDDRRLNFQFGTEIAWEIRGGRLGRMLKNATYTGITPEFWRSCDGVGNADLWVMWGTPNCGKGQPAQIAHTGHGAAPARFRNVRVGVI